MIHKFFVFLLVILTGSILFIFIERSKATPLYKKSGDLTKTALLLRNKLTYSALPLVFEVNKGQTNPKAKYIARNGFYNLFLTDNEAIISLRNEENPIRLKLKGANEKSTLKSIEKLPGISNYFIGNDPKKWIKNIPTYRKIKYENVYPGTDLVYYGKNGELEYDFIVSPFGSPDNIKISLEGAKKIKTEPDGNLTIYLNDNKKIMFQKPQVYQVSNNKKHFIEGTFLLANKNNRELSFKLGEYDPTKQLIIDPVIYFSTVFGGGDFDEAIDVEVPSASLGTIITGTTFSLNFPVTNGAFQKEHTGNKSGDIFVTTIGGIADTILLSSTFIGGKDHDEARGITSDSMNNICITGITNSRDFPVLNAIQDSYGGGATDSFVTKITAGSTLEFSTYLGGSKIEEGNDIAVDSSNNIYVTGLTTSENFPLQNALQKERGGFFGRDAYVTKLNSDGSKLVYSTYLGGSRLDTAYSIAVDKEDNAYIGGTTDSFNFPGPGFSGTHNEFIGFISKINPTGASIIYSFSAGGVDSEVRAVDIDDRGNLYIGGSTAFSNLLVNNAFQSKYGGGKSDGFIGKINKEGTGFDYLTYLGGSGDLDSVNAIVVDKKFETVAATGITDSNDFPLVSPLLGNLQGDTDVFVTKLDETGRNALFSTYLGGSRDERTRTTSYKEYEIESIIKYSEESDITIMGRLPLIPPIGGIDLDFLGNLVVAGRTVSSDFPQGNAHIETSILKGSNVFVTKIGDIPRSSTCYTECGSLCCKQGELCDGENPCNFDPNCTIPTTYKCVAPTPTPISGGPSNSSGGIAPNVKEKMQEAINNLEQINNELSSSSQAAKTLSVKIKFLIKTMQDSIKRLSSAKCIKNIKLAISKLGDAINQLELISCNKKSTPSVPADVVSNFQTRIKNTLEDIKPLSEADDNRNLTPDVCDKE